MVLHRSQPIVLDITTNCGCTVYCRFCPQDVFQSAYKGKSKLSMSDYQTALKNIPKNVVQAFSGFSEPFLNENCIDMIEFAYENGYPIWLYSTLTGLKPEDVDRLRQIKLERFVLHLPDNIGNAKIPITDQYLKTIGKTLVSIKRDGYDEMNESFRSNERSGNCKEAPKRHFRGWFFCHLIKYPSPVMLPNCDVVQCIMDFGLTNKLGNLLECSFADLVNSSNFQKIRKDQYHFRGNTLCRKCAWAVSPFKLGLRRIGEEIIDCTKHYPLS